MKTKLIILTLFITINVNSQVKPFISLGIDPAIAIDKSRPGGGNLNYLVRAGVQLPFISKQNKPLVNNGGFLAGVFYERFGQLYFNAMGLNIGIYKNWAGYEFVGYELKKITTSITFEQGFISRNGIVDNLDIANFKSDDFKPYYIGFNARVSYQILKNIAVEYALQWRARPDINYYYNESNKNTLSGFFGLTFNFL